MLPINTFNHILHEFTDLYMIFINPKINRCSLTQHINYHILNTNNILAQRLNWPTLKKMIFINGRRQKSITCQHGHEWRGVGVESYEIWWDRCWGPAEACLIWRPAPTGRGQWSPSPPHCPTSCSPESDTKSGSHFMLIYQSCMVHWKNNASFNLHFGPRSDTDNASERHLNLIYYL